MLCLGYGVIPKSDFTNNNPTTLYNQLFGSDTIRREIGHYEMIQSIDVTFDLLSSDAFDNFNIRKTVFNDRNFEHFLPLYSNDKYMMSNNYFHYIMLMILNVDFIHQLMDVIIQLKQQK